MVFAVSWQGPDLPDLQQILGRYFDTYVNALNSRDGVSGPGTVALPGLVVQSAGHMRAFSAAPTSADAAAGRCRKRGFNRR